MIFHELKEKMHEQLKAEAEAFVMNPSEEGNETIFYLLKNMKMIQELGLIHGEAKSSSAMAASEEKQKGLWGAN